MEYEKQPVLGVEPSPFELDLAEGERHTAFLRLFPHTPGRTLLAIRATDADGEPLATSELIGLSLADDGLLYRDFWSAASLDSLTRLGHTLR